MVHVTFCVLTILFGGAKVCTQLSIFFSSSLCLSHFYYPPVYVFTLSFHFNVWYLCLFWWFRYVNGNTGRILSQKRSMIQRVMCDCYPLIIFSILCFMQNIQMVTECVPFLWMYYMCSSKNKVYSCPRPCFYQKSLSGYGKDFSYNWLVGEWRNYFTIHVLCWVESKWRNYRTFILQKDKINVII